MTLQRMNPTSDALAGVWTRDDAPADEGPTCLLCKDAGWLRYDVPIGDPNFGQLQRCPCQHAQAVALTRQRSGLGLDAPTAQPRTFATFNPDLPGVGEAYRRCRDYADQPDGWLILHGPYGTGKSHLAMAIGQAVLGRGGLAIFATVPDLLDSLRETYDRAAAGESFETRFNRYRNADLLILDDMGTEKLTSWGREKLFQLVNHRYNRWLPTVFTTNEPLSSFDPRIASRMNDQALVEHLSFAGATDHRAMSFAQRRGGQRHG
jgi:DNA replication protein DnaC